jgi:hypothetical protein
VQSDLSGGGAFSEVASGPYYFVLDNVPEPATLSLLGALGLLARRRRVP